MRKHVPLQAICVGYLMVIVDATIVNVALGPARGDGGRGRSVRARRGGDRSHGRARAFSATPAGTVGA